jgi:hypothetical protein
VYLRLGGAEPSEPKIRKNPSFPPFNWRAARLPSSSLGKKAPFAPSPRTSKGVVYLLTLKERISKGVVYLLTRCVPFDSSGADLFESVKS